MHEPTGEVFCDGCGGWLAYEGQLGCIEYWTCRNCGQRWGFPEEEADLCQIFEPQREWHSYQR